MMTRTEYEAACERATELSEKIQKAIDLTGDELDEFDGLSEAIEHYEEQAGV